MKLSKYEKETIILTNEEDRYYSVYTFNQGLQKRLKNFAERYPECCYLSNSTKEGSETYIIQVCVLLLLPLNASAGYNTYFLFSNLFPLSPFIRPQ